MLNSSSSSLTPSLGAPAAGTPTDAFSSSAWLFSRDTYEKIARFQEVVGKHSDQEFGLSSLQFLEEFQDLPFQQLFVSPHNIHSESLKSAVPAEAPIDPNSQFNIRSQSNQTTAPHLSLLFLHLHHLFLDSVPASYNRVVVFFPTEDWPRNEAAEEETSQAKKQRRNRKLRSEDEASGVSGSLVVV